jgi:hypothetical protein
MVSVPTEGASTVTDFDFRIGGNTLWHIAPSCSSWNDYSHGFTLAVGQPAANGVSARDRLVVQDHDARNFGQFFCCCTVAYSQERGNVVTCPPSNDPGVTAGGTV